MLLNELSAFASLILLIYCFKNSFCTLEIPQLANANGINGFSLGEFHWEPRDNILGFVFLG